MYGFDCTAEVLSVLLNGKMNMWRSARLEDNSIENANAKRRIIGSILLHETLTISSELTPAKSGDCVTVSHRTC
jgi:hypothetical protein